MKLTVPVSILLSITLSLLLSNTSFSQISIQSTKGYTVNVNIQPEEIVTTSKNCQWGFNYDNNDLALLNAGENILFSTTLSKASVDLPSLATGFTLSG